MHQAETCNGDRGVQSVQVQVAKGDSPSKEEGGRGRTQKIMDRGQKERSHQYHLPRIADRTSLPVSNYISCHMAFPPTPAPQPQNPPCLLDSQASSIPCRSFAVSNLSLLSHTGLKVGQPASMRNLGCITEHVEESVCCKHHLTKQQSVQMQQP